MPSLLLHSLPSLFFSCGVLPPSSHYRPVLLSTCSATLEFNRHPRITAPHYPSTCWSAMQSHHSTIQLALLLPISAQLARQHRSLTFQLALLPCIALNLLNN